MLILVTGGAGYIGSHTCVELLKAGYEVVVIDNLCNSCEKAIQRVEAIAGKKIKFVRGDVCNEFEVEAVFNRFNDIQAVIHFAGLKAVAESVSRPLEYYINNLVSTLILLRAMKNHNVKNFVFSSSATVYGNPASVPIRENASTGGTTNPYGTTKLFQEQIIVDCCKAYPELNVAVLRYFNPIGAHESGLIGEDPNGIPNNLLPYISQVAAGRLEKLHVYGNDYPTHDGTGIRDYIHVVDLAKGHVAALRKLDTNCGMFVCNLGTGKGYSVFDVLHMYEKVSGRKIPYVIDPRRPGDVAECYADPQKAKDELGWSAQYDLEEMCASSWKWQSMNLNGYKENLLD